MEYLVVLVVLVVVIYAISSPFRADRRLIAGSPGSIDPASPAAPAAPAVHHSSPLTPDAVAELEAARDAKYREIRDAELDVRTGKLSEADYDAIDGTLRGEAIEILRALDEARQQAD